MVAFSSLSGTTINFLLDLVELSRDTGTKEESGTSVFLVFRARKSVVRERANRVWRELVKFVLPSTSVDIERHMMD